MELSWSHEGGSDCELQQMEVVMTPPLMSSFSVFSKSYNHWHDCTHKLSLGDNKLSILPPKNIWSCTVNWHHVIICIIKTIHTISKQCFFLQMMTPRSDTRSQGSWVWNISFYLFEINTFFLSNNYWSIHVYDECLITKNCSSWHLPFASYSLWIWG